jgi:hypothetical protein
MNGARVLSNLQTGAKRIFVWARPSQASGECRSGADAGKAWLTKNAPHSETFVLSNHMIFRECPEKFSLPLGAFLAQLK